MSDEELFEKFFAESYFGRNDIEGRIAKLTMSIAYLAGLAEGRKETDRLTAENSRYREALERISTTRVDGYIDTIHALLIVQEIAREALKERA